TPSRWCTATYSRQLPGSLRVAKSTALRPQPSSTITHGGESVPGLVIAAPLRRQVPAALYPVRHADRQGTHISGMARLATHARTAWRARVWLGGPADRRGVPWAGRGFFPG